MTVRRFLTLGDYPRGIRPEPVLGSHFYAHVTAHVEGGDPQTRALFPLLIQSNLPICVILRSFASEVTAAGSRRIFPAKVEDANIPLPGNSPRSGLRGRVGRHCPWSGVTRKCGATLAFMSPRYNKFSTGVNILLCVWRSRWMRTDGTLLI